MNNLKTINEQWEGFSAVVFHKTPASAVQRAEMKKAFFAGAWSLFCALEEIGTDRVTEDESEVFLEKWRTECLEFKLQMMAEYAQGN